MVTFAEREELCEKSFSVNGPFWHLYTDGSIMTDIFSCEDEMRGGMIVLAVCAALSGKVGLVTFELMSNHVHLIMCGEQDDCLDFFRMFKKRLRRRFRQAGRYDVDWDRFDAQILRIETLKALRNEIIYVNRNAYVVSRNYTPFSYPWGGGWAYFTPMIDLLPLMSAQDMGTRRVRELTHFREVDRISILRFVGDVPFIPSFCRIDIGQSVFPDARSYFYALTRNAEAFSKIALRLNDPTFLTDDELFLVAARYSEECFATKLRLLSPDQKILLARKLHYEYKASNRMLRRVLNIDIAILNELFPQVSEIG